MAKTKFDIKTEAQKGLHAGVGAADLAIEAVKEYVVEAQKLFEAAQKDAQKVLTTAQKSVKDFEFQPNALRSQATTVLNASFDELSKDAKARRTAIEKRVSDLQANAQKLVTVNVETATGTYDQLAKRGETVVQKLRKGKPGPKPTVSTTTAAPSKPAAKKAPAKKTAKKAPAKKAATSK